MSLIKSKFSQSPFNKTFQSSASDFSNENSIPFASFQSTSRSKVLNQSRSPSSCSNSTKISNSSFNSLLKNLKKREVLVQSDNIQGARDLKEKLIDPKQLQKEYEDLVERYKSVKYRNSMRPCKIPRSGIDICVDKKKLGYSIVNNE